MNKLSYELYQAMLGFIIGMALITAFFKSNSIDNLFLEFFITMLFLLVGFLLSDGLLRFFGLKKKEAET